jgi:hypothetical protein
MPSLGERGNQIMGRTMALSAMARDSFRASPTANPVGRRERGIDGACLPCCRSSGLFRAYGGPRRHSICGRDRRRDGLVAVAPCEEGEPGPPPARPEVAALLTEPGALVAKLRAPPDAHGPLRPRAPHTRTPPLPLDRRGTGDAQRLATARVIHHTRLDALSGTPARVALSQFPEGGRGTRRGTLRWAARNHLGHAGRQKALAARHTWAPGPGLRPPAPGAP